MSATSRRQALRRVLSSIDCINTASVYDPISARLAESVGYEVGILPGSIAAAALLGVPDILILSLPELASLARRMTRYSELSLLVDADHGYGNALNVMRTVEELEAAGVAGLTLEDTILPDQYKGAGEGMVATSEMLGKLKAALRARSDPSLVIVGRTNALRSTNLADAVERLKAYSESGVDAVMVVGVKAAAEIEAIGKVIKVPLIVGNVAVNAPAGIVDRKALAAMGVRIAFQGQAPFMASLKATYDTLKHLKDGGSLAALADKVATDDFFNSALRRDTYAAWKKEFMA